MYNYETRKLSFQLVPETQHYINLRSDIPNWMLISDEIRKDCTCSICNKKFDSKKELDAHEVWSYDDINYVQSLVKIIPVCKDCHLSIHIGYANVQGRHDEAFNRYIRINEISQEEAENDYKEAFTVWENRSQHNYKFEPDLITQVENILSIKCDTDRWYQYIKFEYKDIAKKFGARYDVPNKKWYFRNKQDRDKWIAHCKYCELHYGEVMPLVAVDEFQ